MFLTKAIKTITTYIFWSITIFLIMPVWNNVEEYGTARQVPNDNIIQCMKDVI